MKRLLISALAAGLCACSGTIRVKYDPQTPTRPLAGAAGLTLRLEPVQDQGMGILMRSGMMPTRTTEPLESIVHDAVATELKRLGFSITDSAQGKADLQVVILNTALEWPTQGFSVTYRGLMRLRAVLKSADGSRTLWQTEVAGNGEVQGAGGGYAGSKPERVINMALETAVRRLGEAFSNDNVVGLIGGAPASAMAQAPTARSSGASDVDIPEPNVPATHPHFYSIVIGVGKYRKNLPPADFADADARMVARYVAGYGVPAQNIVTLINDEAGKSDFEKYFEKWLPNHVEAGDSVLVYFSGHGAPDPKTGDAYLVPYDGDPMYLEETAFPLKRLYAGLAKLPTDKVLVVLDSCFSGAGGRSVSAAGARPLVNVVRAAAPGKLTVVSAAAGDQTSNAYREKGHGLFTYYFLKGLQKYRDDRRAVFEYLKPQVSAYARRELNTEQEPQWQGR